MNANVAKSQLVHVWNKQTPRYGKSLILGSGAMGYVANYKYLGYMKTAAAADRLFRKIVNMFKHMVNMGYGI